MNNLSRPIPIIIPCHRVVSKNSLGGFMGETSGNPIHIKTWLLKNERPLFPSHQR
ncbi:MAG: methylated-DNA--[protein]-cysteine S-methyltransferase [Gammaproteobacteria bacterium]|nr:methylated-DNA--[protein]-cysteine S-methyltransferase [Gammaproteobacteria bacterium]